MISLKLLKPTLKIFSRNLKPRQVLRCLSRVASSRSEIATGEQARDENRRLRVDLVAAYREFDKMQWNEAIDNHLSVMAPAADGSGKEVMLISPFGLHWSELTASSLLAVDEHGDVVEGEGHMWYSAEPIHHVVHKLVPEIQCLMHLHPTYTTTLACLKDPSIKLLHGNSSIIYNAIAYDNDYSGFADSEEEGKRLAAFFGPKTRVLIMGNHGVLVSAHDVATAFYDMYYLERSCQFQVLAMSTGKELNELDPSAFDGGSGDLVDSFRTPSLVNAFFDSVKRRLLRDSPEFMK